MSKLKNPNATFWVIFKHCDDKESLSIKSETFLTTVKKDTIFTWDLLEFIARDFSWWVSIPEVCQPFNYLLISPSLLKVFFIACEHCSTLTKKVLDVLMVFHIPYLFHYIVHSVSNVYLLSKKIQILEKLEKWSILIFVSLFGGKKS